MKFTRILALALCLVMAFTVLVSCAQGGKGDETTGNNDVTQAPGSDNVTEGETTLAVDERGYLKDSLPDKIFDDEFKLFTWSNQTYWEFDATEETGNPIYDQVFYRKQHLKDKYGITIAITKENGDWDHKDSFIKVVEANMNETGDNAYDAIACYFPINGAMTVKGFFEDLSNKEYAPYIDLSKPWWPEDLLGSARINGAVYCATGDITPTFIRNLSVCHVNLSLFEQYNPGVNLYDLVRNKEWTYEKMCELILGKVDVASGQQALTINSNVTYDDVFYSSGMTFVENLEDGSIKMRALDSDEKFLDFYQFAYRLLAENDDVSVLAVGTGFAAGKVLVHLASAATIQNDLQAVEFDYACVPYPMFVTETHKDQNEYHSVQGFWTTLYSIPTNCSDYEIASFTLEALASYGYRWLTPTWFEESFQTRFVETPDNAEMLEIVKAGVLFDTARVFGTQINCFGAFRQAASGNPDWISYYNSKIDGWNAAITQINNKLG